MTHNLKGQCDSSLVASPLLAAILLAQKAVWCFCWKAWHCQMTRCLANQIARKGNVTITESCFSNLVLARSPQRGCLAYPDYFHMKDFCVEVVSLAPWDSKPCLFDLGYAAVTIEQDNTGLHSGRRRRHFHAQDIRNLRYHPAFITILADSHLSSSKAITDPFRNCTIASVHCIFYCWQKGYTRMLETCPWSCISGLVDDACKWLCCELH